MKPLSILQVITQRRFSGAERVCLSLCADLQQRGHRVLLLCKPDGGLPDEARKLGLAVQTPNISGKLNLVAPFTLARIARQFGTDVIHTHLSSASLWGGLAGRLAGIPTLGHVHALNTWFYYRFSALAATCSGGVKQYVVAQGADPAKVRVVYNGIPANRLDGVLSCAEARQMLGLAPDQPVVACVAHLSSKKGQIFLLQAVALLRDRFPDLVCLLAGEGEMAEQLQQQAVELGIADRVRQLGFRRDVMSVMQAADVVVLPSIAKEGLGLVLVEAALLEKPTIGSNAPGIDEAVQDGVTGLLVAPGDATALAERLALLLGDAVLRSQMGQAGRQRALQMFTQEAMVDQFEEIYRELVTQ
ncbi:MAG: glycosyltransferase family 4 protein [Trichlorobacter sp.]|uniref:glycosyltransferase family 4 protein n=1 Tax=Trichlorobacter sp. TaxID=2911007 RepID=UPI00256E232C|nr:glycosyltransferase family 4 protein [Trichlorobacter sp.]MDK9718613.1 glycosyltransferase family 4 protein [Trichlorobacter sp.]